MTTAVESKPRTVEQQQQKKKWFELRHAWTDRELPVRDLMRHPRLQRTFKVRRANEIAETFDPDKFGEIWVVPGEGRDSSKWYVFSGQHRVWAVKKLWGDDQLVPCRIYRSLEDKDIAQLFLAIDDQMALSTIDRFLMRVTGGDPIAQGMSHIFAHNDLRVQHKPGPHIVQSISACEVIFTRAGGATALNRTIQLLKSSWSDLDGSYHRDLIAGIGMLVLRHGQMLDEKRLVKTLQYWQGPMETVAAGRDYVSAVGGSVGRGVASVVMLRYNRGRGKGKLSLDGKPNV